MQGGRLASQLHVHSVYIWKRRE